MADPREVEISGTASVPVSLPIIILAWVLCVIIGIAGFVGLVVGMTGADL